MTMLDRLWCRLFHRHCPAPPAPKGSDLWRIERAEAEIALAIRDTDIAMRHERALQHNWRNESGSKPPEGEG